MSAEQPAGWQDGWRMRAVVLAALSAGATLIVMRLPSLLEPTPLADFPVVATLLALFAYFSAAHSLAHKRNAIRTAG